MATLESLNGSGQASLDQFSVPEQKTPVVNVASNRNVAAHSAIMSDDPERVYENYTQIHGDYASKGSSEAGDNLDAANIDAVMGGNKQELIKSLTRPDMTDQEKQTAARNLMDKKNKMYNINNVLSVSAAQAESEPGESLESENARINVASVIQDVNDYKEQEQAMYNAAMSLNDANTFESVQGFFETLLPFSESTQVAAINREFKNGTKTGALKDVLFSGEAKQDIIDSLQKMPPDKRMVAMQHLLDTVESNNGAIYLPNKNKIQSANIIKEVVGGDYSSFDRSLDNVISVLDASIIGAPLAKGVSKLSKFMRGSSNAAEVAEDTRAVARAEEAAEAPARGAVESPEQVPENFEITKRRLEGKMERNDPQVTDSISREAVENNPVAPPKVHTQPDGTQKVNKGAQKRYEKELVKEEKRLRIEARRNSDRAMARNQTQPGSVSQNIKDVNPGKARQAFELAAKDQTGEAAQALYGASRMEAVANDVLPEIARVGPTVKNKVGNPNKNYENINPINQGLKRFIDSDGKIFLSTQEKESARAVVRNNFQDALGLTHRGEMMAVENTDSGMNVRAMFGPSDGGFATSEDALRQAKFALRQFGVDEQNLTLMRREGGEYVPTTPQEAKALEGTTDFQVKVDYNYEIGADSINDWTSMSVKRNFLDRLMPTKSKNGSLNRNFFDPASTLDPVIARGASVQVDKSAALEAKMTKIARTFSDPYRKLPDDRKDIIDRKIKQANHESKWPSTHSMRNEGMTEHEIRMMDNWKDFWDNMYHMENRDMVKTLRNQNYQALVDDVSDTKLFARPLHQSRVSGPQKVYDYREDKIINMSSDDVKNLYAQGGQLGQLKSPSRVGDDSAELVLSQNVAGGGYFRRLNDEDTVLNYREGYYTVRYKSPYFVVKREKDAQGNVLFERAVAASGSRQEAEHAVGRMSKQDGGEYFYREDLNKEGINSDDYWDVQRAGGRTAQKVRGQRLEDASGMNDKGLEHAYVEEPADSMIKAARSMATRAPMRDYLEATKARFANQYAEHLPTDKYGRVKMPNSRDEIGKPGQKSGKDVADARTTFEYIQFLEEGYHNSFDEFLKTSLKHMAHAAGGMKGPAGLYAEKGLRWASEQRSPTNMAKTTAFELYLALSPQRQFFIQAHQGLQLLALEPLYTTTRLGGDMAAMTALQFADDANTLKAMSKLTGRSQDELLEMRKGLRESGLLESVDKHNFVRGSLNEMAKDRDVFSKYNYVGKTYANVSKASRTVGFDLGERTNMMSAWLAFYNRETKANKGKKLSQANWDNITGGARNYTYNMNRAGDMPYNSNVLGMVAQFMQVPHKAMMQVLSNRQLSRMERARIGTFNALTYGLPPGFIYGVASEYLPDDPEMKKVMANGLEGAIYNKILSFTFQEDSDLSFDGFAASDMTGQYEFLTNLMTLDPISLFSQSPGVQAGGRIMESAKVVGQYFGMNDYETSPVTFGETVKSVASLSSGMSNYFKARHAMKYGQSISGSGSVSDSDVSTPEAVGRFFGFATYDEQMAFSISTQMYEATQEFENDVKEWYKGFKSHLAKQGMTSTEREYGAMVLGEMVKAFEGSPRAGDIIRQQLKYDIQNGDDTVYKGLTRAIGIMDDRELRDLAGKAFGSDDKKYKMFIDTLDAIKSMEN